MARQRGYGFLGGLAAAGLLAAYPLAGLGQAQQEQGAGVAELTIGPGVRWDDEDGFEALLGVGGAIRRQTEFDDLDFEFSAGLEQGAGNIAEIPFTDRFLRLTYGRETPRNALDFGLRYRRADINDIEDLDNEDVLEFGDGKREDYGANAGFVFGRQDPFGASLDLRYDVRDYSDTDDADFEDRERAFVAAALRFDIDPRISTEIRGELGDTDVDGGRDTRRETLGLGLAFDVTQTLTSDLFLGQTRVTESGNVPEDTEEGFVLRFSFVEERRNGAWTGSLVSDLTDDLERRTTARVGRSLELPLGAFSAGFGLSQSEDDDVRPLYSLAYTREGPRSAFNVSFDQIFTTDDDGDEALNSRLALSYLQALTELASLRAGLAYRDTTYITGDEEDEDRLDVSLVYRQQLAEDWDLVSSYVHRIDRDDDDTERDDEFYLGIEKTFRRRF